MLRQNSSLRCLFAALTLLTLTGLSTGARPAHAGVDRVEVLERALLAGGKSFGNVGPYERIRGRLYFAIEATAAENQTITDIRLAPRDSQGRITFAADFILLKPLDATRSNNRLLYDVNNRGDLTLLPRMNDASTTNLPLSTTDVGNGFLMEQGYTLLSTGWNWDITPGDGRLRADLPIASDGGKPIFGRVAGEIVVQQATNSARHTAAAAIGYEPVSTDDGRDTLTVRDSAFGPRTLIARERWKFGYVADGRVVFDPSIITLEGGFKPGAIYALSYITRGPRISGLGIAAVRDALLFFRNERNDSYGAPNPLIANGGTLPTAVIAFGTAQGARLLQSMVYSGMIADGRGRMAIDGALLASAGAGRGGFNHRFAQTGRAFGPDVDLDFPSDRFPFATSTQTDATTNESGSVLDRASALNAVPKLFYVNTANEYWTRAASLTHTAVDGSADVPPDGRARIYMIAGASQQLISAPDRANLAHCRDPLDYRPLLRSLLLHLDSWVTLKKEPPGSAIPTLADNTLGKASAYLERFPKVPGLRAPTRLLETPRLDFGARLASDGIVEIVPPRVGKPYVSLVPLADADGLDQSGIRMPEISVPLGTYTGWNPQNAATGAPERLSRGDGSFLPFEPNENERLAAADPRASIAERYPTKDAYTKAYAAATLALAERQLILGSDVDSMIERASALYDRIIKREPGDESCAYLKNR